MRSGEKARRVERRLEWPMLGAALLVIPAIAIESSDPRDGWSAVGLALNWVAWTAFLAELVIMLAVVPNRRAWLRAHPLEVAIVLLTPPFLPAGLQAARAFRLLRLLRLVRAARMLRQLLSLEGLRDVAVLTVFVVLAGGAAYAAAETARGHRITTWDGIWWAINTMTTVGLGGAPHTNLGRVIAIVVMLFGIGFVALLTAAAAERFTRSRAHALSEERRLLESIEARLARLEEQDAKH